MLSSYSIKYVDFGYGNWDFDKIELAFVIVRLMRWSDKSTEMLRDSFFVR